MRVLACAVLAACGGATPAAGVPAPAPAPPVHVVRDGKPPPADAAGIRAQLGAQASVTLAGVWFPDDACHARFGVNGVVDAAAFDALAGCLAGLHWRPSERGSERDDIAVMTYDPGFELEVHVADGKLDRIGASITPMITPATLETLRTAGDPRAPMTAATGHVRICLSDRLENPSRRTIARATPDDDAVLLGDTVDWMFHPLVIGVRVPAVCAIVRIGEVRGRDRIPLPPPPDDIPMNVAPQMMEPNRIAGEKNIPPPADAVAAIGDTKQIGSFKLCADISGRVSLIEILRSTGIASYDRAIAIGIGRWRYRPYRVGHDPSPVCTAVTFVYDPRRAATAT
jgi:hypothetical protein